MPRGDGEPVPEAAEKCGFTDSGNERYACTLRDGLKFSNGDAVTAEDVKFSIDRARAHQGRQRRLRPAVQRRHGRDPGRPRGDLPPQDAPDATFPYKLSTPVAGIVEPRRLHQGQASATASTWTAPARTRWRPRSRTTSVVKAVFTKNPHYKGELKVEERQGRDALLRGRRAMGRRPRQGRHRPDDPHHVARADQQARERPRTATSTSSRCPAWRSATWASTPTPPSVKTRRSAQAMAQVIDRGELVAKVYGTAGRAAVLDGPGQHHRPRQLVLQQLRRPEHRQGPRPR